jgi:acetolactate synthase-1/2/3 large subunit
VPPYRDERARFSSQRSNYASATGLLSDPGERERSSYINELAPDRYGDAAARHVEPAALPDNIVPLRKLDAGKTSSLAPNTAARQLIAALVERGVDTFFGVPGGPVCPVFEAIRLDSRARLVESRHESHAAFAASLFFRASGRVPAVVVTAGPGITNAMTGIASASLERTPMLVIAGDVAWATTGGVMAQDSGPEGIDMEAMLAPITRAQLRAAHARSAVVQALRALDCAEDPRHPGPALFVLPLDRAMEACERVEVFPALPPAPLRPAESAVLRSAAWLSEAKRPLIVVGAGCRGHETALRELIDAANVPFVTTPRAKGLLSEEHPLSLRNGGMAASLWARRYTAEAIDVCLVLGTDLDDTSMGPTRYIGGGGRVIHVDLNARVFGRNLPTAMAITADVGCYMQALSRELPAPYVDRPHVALALELAKRGSPFDVADPGSDDSSPVRPHRLLHDLEAAATPDARFVTDIGEHMLFCLHYLTAKRKDTFHVQLNLGSMGSGIAGAVGLALADRSRRVICVAGDGGMQMSGMEAVLAVRENLPILFVIFNDGRYNMVHHGMRQIFGEASPYSTPPIDFAAWARSFGMSSTVVTKPGEITFDSIERLMSAGGPALIDARIDASVRIRGGGRVEALQHMSMLSQQSKECS